MSHATFPADLDAAAVHYGVKERLPMWTITERPRDYPGGYVARLHVALPEPVVSVCAIYGPTLAAVRAALPPGLICLTRNHGDDPCIVETWL